MLVVKGLLVTFMERLFFEAEKSMFSCSKKVFFFVPEKWMVMLPCHPKSLGGPLSGVVVMCLLALGDPASIEKAGFSKKSIAKMVVL